MWSTRTQSGEYRGFFERLSFTLYSIWLAKNWFLNLSVFSNHAITIKYDIIDTEGMFLRFLNKNYPNLEEESL